MNRQRRKELNKVYNRLAEALCALDDARSELEVVRDDEADALSNMPESLQETDRYQRMEEISESLDEAFCTIEEMNDTLDEVMTSLYDIINE